MKRFWTALFALVATACATHRPADRASLAELSRLRARGQLDEVRLQCVQTALPPAIDEWVATLPERRAAIAQARSGGMSAHARSVQEGMARSDRTNQARQAAMPLLKAASKASQEGDNFQAVRLADAAEDVRRNAERTPTLLRRNDGARGLGPQAGAATAGYEIPWWTEVVSDEDGARLARYAHLRATIASSPLEAEGPLGEAHALEAEDTDVDARYASILLDAYTDPDVACVPAGG